ncbi:MAG: hypothetical protein ACFFB8_14545 [Promethearchaeota archaeon]
MTVDKSRVINYILVIMMAFILVGIFIPNFVGTLFFCTGMIMFLIFFYRAVQKSPLFIGIMFGSLIMGMGILFTVVLVDLALSSISMLIYFVFFIFVIFIGIIFIIGCILTNRKLKKRPFREEESLKW